jgi:hypothetical protein
MKAVAIMTPDPKYFVTKNTQDGILEPPNRFAKMGKTAPKIEQTNITNTDDIRTPIRPSYSFPASQGGGGSASSRARRVWTNTVSISGIIVVERYSAIKIDK